MRVTYESMSAASACPSPSNVYKWSPKRVQPWKTTLPVLSAGCGEDAAPHRPPSLRRTAIRLPTGSVAQVMVLLPVRNFFTDCVPPSASHSIQM
jgi:hypothetical protein